MSPSAAPNKGIRTWFAMPAVVVVVAHLWRAEVGVVVVLSSAVGSIVCVGGVLLSGVWGGCGHVEGLVGSAAAITPVVTAPAAVACWVPRRLFR